MRRAVPAIGLLPAARQSRVGTHKRRSGTFALARDASDPAARTRTGVTASLVARSLRGPAPTNEDSANQRFDGVGTRTPPPTWRRPHRQVATGKHREKTLRRRRQESTITTLFLGGAHLTHHHDHAPRRHHQPRNRETPRTRGEFSDVRRRSTFWRIRRFHRRGDDVPLQGVDPAFAVGAVDRLYA